MAIDLQAEEILSLTDAVKALPRIDGRRPHISTLWRWCRRGVRGVKLEYVRLGHRVCTPREALARFAQRLAGVDEGKEQQPISSTAGARTPQSEDGDLEKAEAELARDGI